MLMQGSVPSVYELIFQSSAPTKVVLVILLLLSTLSWALILSKYFTLRHAVVQSQGFLKLFRESAGLRDVYRSYDRFPRSPLAHLFAAGYSEIKLQIGEGGMSEPTSLQPLERTLRSAAIAQLNRLELGVNWLASIGTSSPFIGLFGTVIGIIIAFRGLSNQAQTSIQAVAPGIAEALISTALGLFAAIPAYMAYNYFVGRIRLISTLMEEFTLELLNQTEKDLAKYGIYRS